MTIKDLPGKALTVYDLLLLREYVKNKNSTITHQDQVRFENITQHLDVIIDGLQRWNYKEDDWKRDS